VSDEQPNRGERPARRRDDDGGRGGREGGDGQAERRPARQDGEERRPRPEQQNGGDRPQRAPRREGDRPQRARREDDDEAQRSDRDGGDRPRTRDRDERPFDAVAASRVALDALQTMTNRTAEGVIGVEREDDGGWVVVVELLEIARIPATADVLGEYEVEIAADRTLRSYARRARYTRASTMSDS
jgi:hypothetical protein